MKTLYQGNCELGDALMTENTWKAQGSSYVKIDVAAGPLRVLKGKVLCMRLPLGGHSWKNSSIFRDPPQIKFLNVTFVFWGDFCVPDFWKSGRVFLRKRESNRIGPIFTFFCTLFNILFNVFNILFGDVLVMCWWCFGYILAMFGDVLAMFWQCFGDVLAMSWQCFGDVSIMSWWCFCYVLVMFRQCFGDILIMFWLCFGNVLPI